MPLGKLLVRRLGISLNPFAILNDGLFHIACSGEQFGVEHEGTPRRPRVFDQIFQHHQRMTLLVQSKKGPGQSQFQIGVIRVLGKGCTVLFLSLLAMSLLQIRVGQMLPQRCVVR